MFGSRDLQRVARGVAPVLRRVRSVPGARRLSDGAQRYFASAFAGPEGWTWVEGFEGRYRLRVHPTHHIGGTIFWHGAHSLNELAVVRQRMGPGKVFVDGGAHLGHFSIVAAGRGAKVLAVEPVEAVRRQLEANVAANRPLDVTVSPCALHERALMLPLFVDPRRPDDPVATCKAAYARTEALGEVQALPLDALLEQVGLRHVDMLKLDLEGAELFALRGAHRTLERSRPELILELSEPLFEQAGYRATDVLDLLDVHGYDFGLITDVPLLETLRRPSLGRFGRVRRVARADLPRHCNIYAAPRAVFERVAG
jgi:FkbM family methyltransferase